MTTIEVRGLAYIRDLFGAKRFQYTFEGNMTVYELLDQLDIQYGLGKIIYNRDKSIVDGIRIILRGRDIAFLEEDQLNLEEGDIVLVMPTLAGG